VGELTGYIRGKIPPRDVWIKHCESVERIELGFEREAMLGQCRVLI